LISGGSIDELVSNSMWAERYAFMILKGLASIALGLTVVGCFSVIAYTVDRRMTEFGVRVALGAQPFDLHRLVMVRSLTTTAIGLVIGTACALGLVRFMCSLLIETTPSTPWCTRASPWCSSARERSHAGFPPGGRHG
jgi:putative ABC transport system permease protein